MINAELSRAFALLADLLEIDGADRFRINTYRRVSRTIKDTIEDLAVLAAEGRLTDLAGVGKGVAEKIGEYLACGRIKALEKAAGKFPPELPRLLEIPGMGPKKVALAYHQLGVGSIADLQAAIDSGKLAALPGLGDASVKKISEGIAFLKASAGRIPLGEALAVAEALADVVAGIAGVRRVNIAGSLRRGVETVGDVDILCDSDDGGLVVRKFVEQAGAQRVLAAGDTKGSITVALPDRRELQIDLRVVPAESFGAALQYFTGSKQHNVRLREIAVRKKLRLSEWGLFDGKKRIAGRTEEDVYAALGVPCVAPELREDRGEFDADAAATALVTLDDIRGDLHMHTTASDGKCSIEEMAVAARDRSYAYIAICDHSRSSTIANGLSIERMTAHISEIRAVNRKLKGITVLVGCECDILPDGSMDYPDEILAQCDIVVASIHSAMDGKRSATKRTIAAMNNPYVTIIGHPTGRLLGRRKPMELDMAVVVRAAAETGTVLEVNAAWKRLDLKDVHVRQALDAGVTLCINCDAHSVEGLDQMRLGLLTARRGGASAENVLNTRPLAALRRFVARQRRRADAGDVGTTNA